jgi:hypothetical protein
MNVNISRKMVLNALTIVGEKCVRLIIKRLVVISCVCFNAKNILIQNTKFAMFVRRGLSEQKTRLLSQKSSSILSTNKSQTQNPVFSTAKKQIHTGRYDPGNLAFQRALIRVDTSLRNSA